MESEPKIITGRICIRLPFIAELERLAQKANRTKSDYVRIILQNHVNKNKPKRKKAA